MIGRVQSYNPAKSFGFILYLLPATKTSPEIEEIIFVHRTDIVAPIGYQKLRVGATVYFEISEYNGRPTAKQVVEIKGAELNAPANQGRTNERN